MRPWTPQEALAKEDDIRDMFTTYGQYTDMWLRDKTGDPNLVIWDFTDKELKAIVKWCSKRGQTTGVVAWSLDRAMEGRTDLDFAIIMGSKTIETGWRLGMIRQKPLGMRGARA